MDHSVIGVMILSELTQEMNLVSMFVGVYFFPSSRGVCIAQEAMC